MIAMLRLAGLALLALSSSFALEPSDVYSLTKVCSMSSPEFTKCIKAAFQTIVSDFANEDIEEDERMDPLRMPDLPFSYGALPMERMGITLSDMALHGLSRTTINGVRANVKDKSALRLEVDIRNPLLYFEGNYSAQLTGAEEPVSSQGNFNVSIIDVRGTLLVKGHVVVRDEKEFLQIDKAGFKPQISNMKMSLTNDDDPYPDLTTMVVSLINSYWRLVYIEAMPAIEESLDRLLRAYAEELTMEVPFNEIVAP